MRAAFDDRSRRYQRKMSRSSGTRNGQHAAVAHRRTNLCKRTLNVVLQRTCIRNVRVNAFLKRQLLVAAEVITLPVAGTVAAFAPVFLHIVAVDDDLVGGRLIKSREVTAHHQEVSAHRQRKGHVIIMNNAAVRADRNINTGLFKYSSLALQTSIRAVACPRRYPSAHG